MINYYTHQLDSAGFEHITWYIQLNPRVMFYVNDKDGYIHAFLNPEHYVFTIMGDTLLINYAPGVNKDAVCTPITQRTFLTAIGTI